ncbi:unnamed protein product [Caenorhabditis sp. 36 PRJEB53466]|nr:unnamed protein product [Caenorhabditis sp. 36 PRJEB53466]
MRRFIVFLFAFTSIISTGNVVAKLGATGGNRTVPDGAADFAGAEILSTNPEEMQEMRKLQPKFQLMN